MKILFLIIFATGLVGIAGIQYSYALCAVPLIGPCFDSYTGSHEQITEEYIMNYLYLHISANYDSWKISDRVFDYGKKDYDLPAIICTEFVAGDMKQYRMAKWADEHRISSWETHYDPSLCDKWLPPMSSDLPVCDQNPKHDFGKCQKMYEEAGGSLQKVLDLCSCQESGGPCFSPIFKWWNTTHYIDTVDCQFLDKIDGSPTYGQVISLPELSTQNSEGLPDEQICSAGFVLVNGICMDENTYRVDDSFSSGQKLQTGPSLGNDPNPFGWFALGISIFIITAYVIMKIKKRKNGN